MLMCEGGHHHLKWFLSFSIRFRNTTYVTPYFEHSLMSFCKSRWKLSRLLSQQTLVLKHPNLYVIMPYRNGEDFKVVLDCMLDHDDKLIGMESQL